MQCFHARFPPCRIRIRWIYFALTQLQFFFDRDANERFYDYPFGSGQLVLEGEAVTAHDADAVANWRATLATHAR